MTIESASYISQLNNILPEPTDGAREGDNHIRLVKSVLQATFPNLSGPMTLTQQQLNFLPFFAQGSQLRGKVVTTEGQLSVTVPFTYPVGANALLVLAEGRILRLVDDYLEASATSITLDHALPEGTEVDFIGGVVVSAPGPLANTVTTYGDVNATLSLGDYPLAKSTHVWFQPLATTRIVTFSLTGAFNGGGFRIVRTANSTGTFLLSLLGLKVIGTGQWADVEFNGTAFMVTASGSL